MKKIYTVILLIITLIFLSTFNSKELNLIKKPKKSLFLVNKIDIKNNSIIKKNEIEKKLANIYKKNIFLIKKSDLEEPLKNIDFLERVEVNKKYPNTIIVKIFETKPVAIFFKNKTKYLLDSSSNKILFENQIFSSNLPNIFGKKAENYFVNFFNKLQENSFPNEKIKNFYYFQIGRWDIELFNNQVIKLPYKNTNKAIIKSVELIKHEDFKNYNIIDFRVDGKIVVE